MGGGVMYSTEPLVGSTVHNNGIFVSQSIPKSARSKRYSLRRVLWTASTRQGQRACGRCRRDNVSTIRLLKAPEGWHYFDGIQKCGFITCPTCGARISRKRAAEIGQLAESVIESGGSLAFQTFTLPHAYHHKLSEMLDDMAVAWRRVIGGKAYKEDKSRFDIVGYVKTREDPHGINGWHPHLHVLWVSSRELSNSQWDTFQAATWIRWARAIAKHEVELTPDSVSGKLSATFTVEKYGMPLRELCPLEPVRELKAVGRYMTKVQHLTSIGFEMANGVTKKGKRGLRMPMEILSDFERDGDARDIELWQEFERATLGKHSITWSRGLKKMYGIEDKKDEDLVDEKVQGESVLNMKDEEFSAVAMIPGAMADMLDYADAGDMERVYRIIADSVSLVASRGEAEKVLPFVSQRE